MPAVSLFQRRPRLTEQGLAEMIPRGTRRVGETIARGKVADHLQGARAAAEDPLHGRAPGHLPDRLLRSPADRQPGAIAELGGTAKHQHGRKAVRHRGHVWRDVDRHEHDLRPGDHALYLGVDHLSASGKRRSLARGHDEGRRERAKTHQRIHPLRHRRPLRGPERLLGAVHDESTDERGTPSVSRLLAWCGVRLDHDGGHDLPDVGRRADRRIRDRQRDQPAHHGRNPGPGAGGHERALGKLDFKADAGTGQVWDHHHYLAAGTVHCGRGGGDCNHRRASDESPPSRPSMFGAGGSSAVPGNIFR